MKVNLSIIMQTLEELQRELQNIEKIEEELQSVLQMIISMESLEVLLVPLRKQEEAIYQTKASLCQMALALEKICCSVERCENYVIEEIQKERVVYDRLSIKMLEMPDWDYGLLKSDE